MEEPRRPRRDTGPTPERSEAEGKEEDLGDLLKGLPNAILYVLAALLFLAVMIFLTRLLVPGPLES